MPIHVFKNSSILPDVAEIVPDEVDPFLNDKDPEVLQLA